MGVFRGPLRLAPFGGKKTVLIFNVENKKAQLPQGLRATEPPPSEPRIAPFDPPTPKTLYKYVVDQMHRLRPMTLDDEKLE